MSGLVPFESLGLWWGRLCLKLEFFYRTKRIMIEYPAGKVIAFAQIVKKRRMGGNLTIKERIEC
ncbi:hypothetical protein MHL86_04970 [Brevibacillus laterosporus]|nr:hypothetical protein [Brevibacillus laterosporus]